MSRVRGSFEFVAIGRERILIISDSRTGITNRALTSANNLCLRMLTTHSHTTHTRTCNLGNTPHKPQQTRNQ